MIPDLLIYLLISIALNLALFLIAFKLQSDKLTDASYAASFLILTAFALFSSNLSIYAIIISLLVAIWALRIGGFLVYRVIKVGKDSRFDTMRSNFFSFLRFWLLQAVAAWVLLLPVFLALSKESTTVGTLAVVGAVVASAGITIETIADTQKWRFTRNPSNKNKWIDSGIWRYSRHPNYFGEILVWVGVFVYSVSVLSGFEVLIAAASPLLITILLLFVSGIPLLEKSADARWGKKAAYKKYKARTSILVPLPPKQ